MAVMVGIWQKYIINNNQGELFSAASVKLHLESAQNSPE